MKKLVMYAKLIMYATIGILLLQSNTLFTSVVAEEDILGVPRSTAEQSEAKNPDKPIDEMEIDQIDFTTSAVTQATSTYPGCDTKDITLSGFTIAACNVGATKAGTGYSIETSGEKFQRGNNNGWMDKETPSTSPTQTSIPSTTFILCTSANNYCNNTSDWITPQNDTLRGGSTSDGPTTIPVMAEDEEVRQGPCATGYHVPSQGERNQLLITWAKDNNVSLKDVQNDGYKSFDDSTYAFQFRSDFLLPLAGRRDYGSADLHNKEYNGLFWSSSPSSPPNLSYACYLNLNVSYMYVNTYNIANRAYGGSVRCFKNIIDPSIPIIISVTSDPAKGIWTTGSVTVTVKLNQTGSALSGWTLSGAIFTKVFTDNWSGTVDFPTILGGTVSTGISVKNILQSNESGYPGCDMPDITFSGFILAACNVGATVAGTGYSIQTSGKKFQRGNNYGRYDDDNPSPSSNKVLRPTPPFSSSTFIKSSSDWATIPNAALRGGSTSDGPTTIPTTLANLQARQGPCATGYHVPSQGEWNQLLITWTNDNGISSILSDDSGYKSFSDSTYTYASQFSDDFLLPGAGYRDNSSVALNHSGVVGYFWSSSPRSNYARYLVTSFSNLVNASMNNSRALGHSVRCFKNITNPIIISITSDPAKGTWTTGSVTVTVTFDQNGAALSGWTLSGAIFTKVFTENWSGTVIFPSALSRTVLTGISVLNIDKIPPTISNIEKSTTTSTSGSVTLTVTASDSGAGLDTSAAYSFDDGDTRQIADNKAFTGNGTIIIKVRDAVGNISSTGLTINNIDTAKPTCSISYDSIILTNHDVVASLTGCSEPITVTNNSEHMPNTDYLFTGNGSFTFLFQDTAGNTGSTIATVTWIDKTPPSGGGSGGGGGGAVLKPDTCPNGDFSPSYYDGECSSLRGLVSSGRTASTTSDDSVSSGRTAIQNNEHNPANETGLLRPSDLQGQKLYERAKEYHLTSAETYEAFRPNDIIIRSELAKITSIYSKEFLQKTLDTSKEQCTAFSDINTINPELQSYIIQACELGLMGLHSDGKTQKEYFSPNEPITKAEVATVISRMLRGNTNKGSEERWYQNHLLALYKTGIIKDQDNPLELERREAVFEMLNRIKSI